MPDPEEITRIATEIQQILSRHPSVQAVGAGADAVYVYTRGPVSFYNLGIPENLCTVPIRITPMGPVRPGKKA